MGLAQIVRTARAASLVAPNGRKIPAMTLGNYEVIAAEGWSAELGPRAGREITDGVLVEPALRSFLFLALNVCLHDGHELLQRGNLGPALRALNDAVPDGGAMDGESGGAALTTLQ
jgi:hypothetical protein